MHATAPAPDFPAQLPFTNLMRLQDDALQTIHTIMRHLAEDLTTPRARGEDEEDSPQLKTATQRIRLCLQAAREILRFSPQGDGSPPSPVKRGKVAEAQGGRMRGPSSSFDPTPTQPATTLLAAARPVRSGAERMNAGSEVATQSVSPPSRFSERLPPSRDSSLVAHHSVSPDPRLSTHDSASAASTPPPVPPEYFTHDEFNQIITIMGSERDLLTPALYARIQEWNAYAIPAGLSSALGITAEKLEARKPHNPADQRAAPTQ